MKFGLAGDYDVFRNIVQSTFIVLKTW